jgi:hypothetical protein
MTEEPMTVTEAPWKEDLYSALRTLAARYDWNAGGHANIASLAKLIATNVCEKRIDSLLKQGRNAASGEKFDSIYREKSEFATLVVLDHVKRRIVENGYSVRLSTETRDTIGVYDIVIASGTPCTITRRDRQIARVEIKGALGLPLEQIGRYLFNDSPLVLARLLTGHVALFQPRELAEFGQFYASTLTAKAERLNAGEFFTVPGRYCLGCPCVECPNRIESRWKRKPLISIKGDEFEHDITSLFSNLGQVSEKVATLVLKLLEDAKGDRPIRSAQTPDG